MDLVLNNPQRLICHKTIVAPERVTYENANTDIR